MAPFLDFSLPKQNPFLLQLGVLLLLLLLGEDPGVPGAPFWLPRIPGAPEALPLRVWLLVQSQGGCGTPWASWQLHWAWPLSC